MVAIPGSVSFTILKSEVGQIHADVQAAEYRTEQFRMETDSFKRTIADKLEEIQRSLGRVEGKLDERK